MEEIRDQIKKINVKSDYELTDVIRIIQSVEESAILLIFTEHSDLLVSPINLQVIQEIADEREKPLIFQIIDNRAGVRNVSEIGAVHIDSAQPISTELWEKSFSQMVQRRSDMKDALKRSGGAVIKKENKLDDEALNKQKQDETLIEPEKESEKRDSTEIITLSAPTEDGLNTVDEIKEDVSEEDIKDTPDPLSSSALPIEDEPEKPKSAFSERIDAALEKSKIDIENAKTTTVEQGGLRIAVAHDIDDDGNVPKPTKVKSVNKGDKPQSLTGRDFIGKSTKTTQPDGHDQLTQKPTAKIDDTASPRVNIPQNPHGKPHKISRKPSTFKSQGIGAINGGGRNLGKVANTSGVKSSPVLEKVKSFFTKSLPHFFKSRFFKKAGLFIFIPLLLVGGVAAYVVYTYKPLVNVDIYIESRPVAATKSFTGNPETAEFDLEAAKIQVKKENVTKDRSDSTNATGTASRGTKASGIVRFQCTDPGARVIPAGTTLTTDELSFILVGDVAFDCPTVDFPTGTAEADDFGAEYNISSGVLLDVGIGGEPTVIGITETSFTGGSKEEYTIISQTDYDRVVNPLKDVAYNEAENDLEDLATDGWEMITNTVKHELDGVVESDFPVGAEADILNVTVKTKSSALYYKKDDLEDAAKDILLSEAKGQNLFDTESDLDLQLGDDFISDITVEKIEGNTVTVKLTLSGAVKPSVNDDEILSGIEGRSWDEGLKFLSELTFVAKDTEVSFKPDYFPKNLRYFPSRQGRILIDIHEVEPEAVVPEEGE